MTYSPEGPEAREIIHGIDIPLDDDPVLPQRQPESRVFHRVVRGLGWGLLAGIALFTWDEIQNNAGPKDGLMYVVDDSCNVVGGLGVQQAGDYKEVVRVIEASGQFVIVEVVMAERPESEVRDPGFIEDPAVTVAHVGISCVDMDMGERAPITPTPGYGGPEEGITI